MIITGRGSTLTGGEELDFVGDDVKGVALASVLRLIGARLDGAGHGDLPALSQITAAELGELTPGDDVEEISFLLARLRTLWTAQKELVTGKEKLHSALPRVLYAIVFFLSLCLAVWFLLAMCGHQIIKYAGLIPHIPLWLIGAVLLCLLADGLTRFIAALLARRRFLSRLAQLTDRGVVTYTVEGHPYLSLLSSRLYAGVTVTHRTSVSNLRHETVYRVGLIRGGRRKSILILCRNQVYRLMHKLPGQGLIFQSGSRGRIIHKPMYAWFESKAFDLPEGEGEGVLLVEPFPAVIAEQIADEEECFWELGIGSRSFGHTVHSPNSFLHLLERT